MKHFALVIFFICIHITVSFAQGKINKTTRIYFESGQLQMEIVYDAGCSCKTYSEYYMDGKVLAKRTFKVTDAGEYVDGAEISYYNDGSIKYYKMWKEAVPDGRSYTNYENGKLEHEEFYENKRKTGTWRYYDKKGMLLKEMIFENSKTPWNSKKNYATNRYFVNGKLAYTEKLEAGKKGEAVVNDKASFFMLTAKDSVNGKTLYQLKCSVCHAPDKDGYGPALAGITKRRTEEWLISFIRNGMDLVDAGDDQAVLIYNKWRKQKHFNFEKLSRKQIQSIVDHLKTFK